MKEAGIKRPLDNAGRVVIPNELRKLLDMENGKDSFEIFFRDNEIVLKKYRPSCFFCGKLGDSIKYGGYSICFECIEKMSEQKIQTAAEKPNTDENI